MLLWSTFVELTMMIRPSEGALMIGFAVIAYIHHQTKIPQGSQHPLYVTTGEIISAQMKPYLPYQSSEFFHCSMLLRRFYPHALLEPIIH